MQMGNLGLAVTVRNAVHMIAGCGLVVGLLAACGGAESGAADAIPTSDSGGACRLGGLGLARAVAGFPLAVPDPVPNGFTFDGVVAEAPFIPDPDAEPLCEDAQQLMIYYVNDDGGTVQVLETSLPHAGDRHDGELVEINGVEVLKLTTENDGGQPIEVYEWVEDEVTIQVYGLLARGVTSQVLESFVAALAS